MQQAQKLNVATLAAMLAAGMLAAPSGLPVTAAPVWIGRPRPRRVTPCDAPEVLPKRDATSRQLRRLRDRQLAKAVHRAETRRAQIRAQDTRNKRNKGGRA